MSKAQTTLVLSDDLSSDIASAILTKQKEWGEDPLVLLNLVRSVHDTLRELSLRYTREEKVRRPSNSDLSSSS